MNDLQQHIDRVVAALNVAQAAYHAKMGYNFPSDKVVAKERRKFIAIDIGSSGAFLVEKETGEIFNIKAYGVPDHNKKLKANLGNIRTVDPAILHQKRWNYLR